MQGLKKLNWLPVATKNDVWWPLLHVVSE